MNSIEALTKLYATNLTLDNKEKARLGEVIMKDIQALEIIKNKNPNIDLLKEMNWNYDYYCSHYLMIPNWEKNLLTQEEFDLLKGVLGK